jgi:hypothetical protein
MSRVIFEKVDGLLFFPIKNAVDMGKLDGVLLTEGKTIFGRVEPLSYAVLIRMTINICCEFDAHDFLLGFGSLSKITIRKTKENVKNYF